jgi:virginiamycin B lyase
MWFTEANGFKVGNITPTGTISEFPTTYSVAIAAGLDGNLSFTEQLANKIGRITTAGIVTDYPVPTGGSSPNYITPGPDGNLWFTEVGASQIGKITLASIITEYPTGPVADQRVLLPGRMVICGSLRPIITSAKSL